MAAEAQFVNWAAKTVLGGALNRRNRQIDGFATHGQDEDGRTPEGQPQLVGLRRT
jgi:hypothetical protein